MSALPEAVHIPPLRGAFARITLCVQRIAFDDRDALEKIVSRSQIVALEAETIRLRQYLESHGIVGSTFCAPATRPHRSLMRLSLHAALSDTDLKHILSVCSAARECLNFTNWPSTRRRQRLTMF
jgi:hypothetical protein